MILLEQFLAKLSGNIYSGEFASKLKGTGYDLEDFKEYQPGDNIKKINWKMLAKYDKEFVAVFKQEQDLNLKVIFDNNSNLEFFESEIKKFWDYLNILLHKFGLNAEFYQFGKNELKRINDISDLKIQKKLDYSVLNKFSNQATIFVSDLLFVKSLDFLIGRKIFVAYLPAIDFLKNSSFAVLNGYFDSSLCKDFLEEENEKISKIKSKILLEKVNF